MAIKTGKLMIYLEPETAADFRIVAALESKTITGLLEEMIKQKIEEKAEKIAAFKA